MTREEQAQYISEKLMENPEFRKAFASAVTNAVNEVVKATKVLQQELCNELDFVQPHKKVSVNLDVCKMREATQEEREGVEKYIDSIAEPCTDVISRQQAIDTFYEYPNVSWTTLDILEKINSLPPVKSAEKQKPCEDCINREETLKALMDEWTEFDSEIIDFLVEKIKKLPSVTPTEKVGWWIVKGESWCCSRCDEPICEIYDGKPYEKYCPNCGVKMQEVSRNEDDN